MYADRITDSMKRAIGETDRRRDIQQAYNQAHGITPQTIQKRIKDLIETTKVAETVADYRTDRLSGISKSDMQDMLVKLEKEMRQASKMLEFERAAELRDMMIELRQRLGEAKTAAAGKGSQATRKRVK